MKRRELIEVPGLGNPKWYAGGSRFGDLVWTAGQVPVNSEVEMPEPFREQAELVLDNLETTLKALGSGMGAILKMNAYLESLDDFDLYNEVYVKRMTEHGLPPRTTVEVVRFPPPMKIEIEVVAHVLR